MRKPCAVLTITAMLFGGSFATAQDHLVTKDAAQARIAQAKSDHQRDLATLEKVLDSPRAQRLAKATGHDLDRAQRGLALLSDAEARDLARRAAALKADPVAGYHESADDLVVLMVLGIVAIAVLSAAVD